MNRKEVRAHVNRYCRLRDVQYAAYTLYAGRHGLTTKELFVLNIIWFAPDGCSQAEICKRLSATKQTVSAIIKKFLDCGYLSQEESAADRRRKTVRLTEAGRMYAKKIIPPAADAEINAMAALKPEEIADLVRLTALFSKHMEEKFQALDKEQKI